MSSIIILEIITAIVTAIYRKKLSSTFRLFFLLYIWILCIVEVVAMNSTSSSIWIYNIYTFLEFNLILLMYNSILKKKISKNLIILFVIIINCMASYFTITNGLSIYNSITVVAGSLMVTIIVLLYLQELLGSEKILNYRSCMYFWISVGMLVYYLGSIPFQAVIGLPIPYSARYIPVALSVVYYLSINIGMIWGREQLN